MKKGQMFSIDIIVAAGIALLILITSGVVWTHMREKIYLTENKNDMEVIARNALYSLMRSEGNPTNWTYYAEDDFNITNIKSLGIGNSFSYSDRIEKEKALGLSNAGAWELDWNKMFRLYELNDTKYETFKQLLGIKGPGYEFYLNFNVPNGINGFLGPGDIAYTYGKSDGTEGNSSHYGIHDYMINHGVPFVDFEDRWEELIENISDYKIVIFENPEIDDNDVDFTPYTPTLQDWVAAGGTFFQKQSGTILEIFNATGATNSISSDWGTVIETNGILINVEIGDIVNVLEGYRINKNVDGLVTLVEATPTHALHCWWPYGNGRVIYSPDTDGNVSSGGILTHNETRSIIFMPGDGGAFEIGLKPNDNASHTIRVDSIALYNNNWTKVYMNVWQRCNGVTC